MKNYVGCKIIKALEMTYGEYRKEKYGDTTFKSQIPDDTIGYIVIYPGIGGGKQHKSWSPKKIFEMAYREIDDSEVKLMGE